MQANGLKRCGRLTACFSAMLLLSGPSLLSDSVTEEERKSGLIKNLIAVGEGAQAIDILEGTIKRISREQGRNSAELIEPLVLKGDALVSLGKLQDAIEVFDDARTIRRQQFGLHDLDQIDILYREADIYYSQELYAEANDRHEYAYSIYVRKFGTDSEEILPGLFRLADWYMDTNNILTARGLFVKALDVEEALELDRTDVQIRALSGLAKTYRLEKFRPSDFKPKNQRFIPRPYGSITNPEHYYPELNDYAKGEEALLELLRIHMAREAPTSFILADAKLQLADWYLLFEKPRKAKVIYKDIWDSLAGTPQFSFVEENMIVPKLLYKPVPNDPEPPESMKAPLEREGRIELSLNVTESGKTKKIKEIQSIPGAMLERATKLGAENAIYRPAFVDGEPTETLDVAFVHTFPYYIDGARRGSGRLQNDSSTEMSN